ncbi:hypothetical protein AHAS_Ahas20G0146700 [Arachis hypogaea]
MEKLCIDEMLLKYYGEFRKWQLKHFIFTNLAWALEACHTMVMIFADDEPELRCTAAAFEAVGNTCGIRPEEWE